MTALRVALAAHGWTPADLSRICSMRVESIYNYNAGRTKPSKATLDLMRAALGPELARAERRFGKVETKEKGRPRATLRT